jgi:hypothetical protein
MRLGEMLIRDGRMTEEQLTQALATQRKVGGRLGTIMVEMGLVDLDALTVYLGLELGIPIATGAALERAKKLAVRLLTPAQAVQYRCVPLLIQDRQLVAAIEDPLDMEILGELQEITGHRILPRVAPEIRIYYYIERYYGAPRPKRFAPLGDAPRSVNAPDPGLPAPPLPGLPPRAASVVQPPTPAPPLRMGTPPPEAQAPRPKPPLPSVRAAAAEEDYEELELDAADLVVELESDATDAAGQAPAAAPAAKTAPAQAAAPASASSSGRIEAYEPRDLVTTLDAINDAASRNDIARALMGYARSLFDTAALCIVRDNMAFGWKAFGSTVEPGRVEALLMPLDAPSLFQIALNDEDQLYTGAPFPSTLHNYFYKVLRCPPPAFAYVRVISIGKRIVNILYGHRDSADPLPEVMLEGLKEVGDEAAEAYVRMITTSKKGSARSGAHATPSDPEAEFEVPTKVGKKTGKRPPEP